MAPIKRTENAIEVSQRAFNFFTGLVTALVLGVTAVFWNLVTSNVVLTQQVEGLVKFKDRGDRWTLADGQRNSEAIAELQLYRIEHTRDGHQLIGLWTAQHASHAGRLDRLEEHVNVSNEQ